MGELLRQDRYAVDGIYAVEQWVAEVAPEMDVPLTVVTPKELDRISQLTTPNQVLAVVSIPKEEATPPSAPDGWCLYLDGIQSPSNLGALLRIADWFGFPSVYGGPGTADLYNSKSIQASMGSFLRIDYRTATLAELVALLPGVPVFGADLDGETIYRVEAPPAGILVIGGEGPGIRDESANLIQRRLTIPRAPGRETESLNAAVAAGILMGWLGAGPGQLATGRR
ncbi:TrmH family RNA methyltransferase [Neolewinella xylanilytica]|uniref:TrmH family RNA methyltransferase n=1 Tax=Neolewinella xylanilytica TaxID=1514080 RepID=A0A2S6I7Z7_9BACT|nr:TrmH family RNA methyltransferase [Neolewinella xylanilytica]